MREGARLQAVIELLEIFQKSPDMPFDSIVRQYMRGRRYIGSHDRQYIGDKAFTILRHWFSYRESLGHQDTPRLMVFFHEKKSIETGPYGPSPLDVHEKRILESAQNVPDDYLPPFLKELFSDEKLIPSGMPTVDIRVNTLKTTREEVLKVLDGAPTPYSPYGVRLQKRTQLNDHPLWKQGFVDIQDEGSQLAALLCDVSPEHQVLDLCAGAGGKTLALAAMMKNKGTLIGTDVAQWRLERAKERLKRSGVHNVQMRPYDSAWLSRQKGRFDRVLVDAPCSGSGTWRRNPDLKIRTTKEQVEALADLQRTILTQAAKLVKVGGRLIYVTCSLFEMENQQQIGWFLKNHADFELVPIQEVWERCLDIPYPSTCRETLQLNPREHQTDGFFVGIMVKKFRSF